MDWERKTVSEGDQGMPHFKNCSNRSQEVTLAGDAGETRKVAAIAGEAKLSGPVGQPHP